MTLNSADQAIDDLVKMHGWTKLHARGTAGDPNSKIVFTTTVNLDEAHGLPELIIFGLEEDVMDAVIAGIIAKREAGFAWTGAPVQFDKILQDHPIELRALHPEPLNVLFERNIAYRKATGRPALTEAVQVFWPGKDGKFPWDEGHVDSFFDQPRLDIPRPA